MRTIIDIPSEILNMLDERLKKEKISRAEVIRRAITLWLGLNKSQAPPVFGIWKEKGSVDGIEYQKKLRDEWAKK